MPLNNDTNYLKEGFYKRLCELRVEPTSEENIERIVSSATNAYEDNILETIFNKSSVETISKFDSFLAIESENNNTEQTIWFNDFNINPDGANIESIFNEASKLRTIEDMVIPK